MSTVAFTTIADISDLDSAQWKTGVQDSYARTARMFPELGAWDDHGAVRLIGRLHKHGPVEVVAALDRRGELRYIGWGQMELARFFLDALGARAPSESIDPFIGDVPQEVRKIMVSLICAECGFGRPVGDNILHQAVLKIMGDLRCLRVPVGDWTFLPMLDAYHQAVAAA